MPGKTATGNSGKVPYYEHSWATKRDSTLSKKIFKCDPHRVPAKKLEPVAWEKIVKFVTDPEFTSQILEKVRKLHETNPARKDTERLKAKIMGISSQIDALSERLSELPKTISAAPIYKQMEKLQGLKDEHEEGLLRLKTDGISSLDRIVGLETFEEFSGYYKKFVLTGMEVTQQKQMIQKFVRKIEVGTESFKIHFIVDKDHYKRGLALVAGSRPSGSGNLFTYFGSNTLTNGAPGETRTLTPLGTRP